MPHPAEVPISAILAVLPDHSRVSGLWVQSVGDGTLERARGPFHVSIQWRRGGYADTEGASGPTVGEASAALLTKLRERFRR